MKTIKHLLFYLIVVILFVNCDKKENNVEPEFELSTADDLDTNEYQIYSLILKEHFTNNQVLIVKQETTALNTISLERSSYEYLKTVVIDIDSLVIASFHEINDSIYNLDNSFGDLKKEFKLISSDEHDFLFKDKDLENSWVNFYKKYPNSNGIISFTRVGFNTNKNIAILEVSHSSGSLGGEGTLIFLTKDNNGWKIINTLNIWIS